MTTTTVPDQQRQRPEKDPMRFHLHYQHAQGNRRGSPYAGGSSFMERVSEAVASGMGTVAFLVVSSAVILAWVLSNHVITFVHDSWTGLLNGKGFDPAPFILLNLVFSAVAFYTGALVIIAQKAQTRTDHANEEAAAKHRAGHMVDGPPTPIGWSIGRRPQSPGEFDLDRAARRYRTIQIRNLWPRRVDPAASRSKR
jgi:uncharacterized membrane protein